MEFKPPLTVCFLNRKGGVGKTSSVYHLAGVYASAGKRVLVCDLDPQFSLTQGLLGARPALSLPKHQTVAALFDDTCDPDPDAIIRPTAFDRIFLAPSSSALNRFNVPEPQSYDDLQGALAMFVNDVKHGFDVVLIDCPPNLNLCSWAALLAAEFCIIPLQPEDFGGQGIIHVLQQLELARSGPNPRLSLMGFLLTMVRPRLGIHTAYREQLQAQYQQAVFTADVPDLTHFKEAVTVQKPISYYKPKVKATKAMIAVAEEIVARASAARFPVEITGGERSVA